MKTLKFEHYQAEQILRGEKTSTWRLFDDKDISVNDKIKIIDKITPEDPASWQVIGLGTVKEIIEKNLGDINADDMKNDRSYTSQGAMLNNFKQYYGDRVAPDTPVKIVFFDFKPGADKTPSQAMLLEEANLYTDGGSRGNPGDSSCAYVICDVNNNVVEKSGYYMGMATNNQAEYLGFKKGLERARDLGIGKITLHSDSQLVVNQMNGIYKVKNQELAPLHQDVKELAKSFETIRFVYVPRELNKIADKEVNRILDQQERARHRKH
ncbi:MAG TPA: reverse transcriptase-like protein [Candidatus Saccharimonadales bacterium]|nr:reverse transcriptase-like protein [Candidatus Saccharimonadales bacterium]